MILKARKIKKQFLHPIKIDLLRGIDLDVAQGETCAIMGRSGEGKSTLLQILGTLDTPTDGTLEIASQTVVSGNQAILRNRELGFVFQSFHLLEDYTVLQNVLMPSLIARKDVSEKSEAFQRALWLLEQIGLIDRKDHFAKQLSGGEKQRVAIARALQNDPSLILADEPSGNLDRKTADGIHTLLLSFVNDHKKSLIVVTHDEELANLCQSHYRLNTGLLDRIR
ncbi:MAG: ABC transporter ATP-binding protein [Parachlamydiaceae bacterium]